MADLPATPLRTDAICYVRSMHTTGSTVTIARTVSEDTALSMPRIIEMDEYDVWKEDDINLISTIHVCQGPPHCNLSGDDAVNQQKAGCIWCAVIRCYSDGSEEVTEPYFDDKGES